MRPKKPTIALVALIGAFTLAPHASAVEPVRFTGSIAGQVTDSAGIPQMGAVVFLFDRFEHLVKRASTDERGYFRFLLLNPDSYSVRVSLAAFVPALRRGVSVQSGIQSFLAINMNSLLSSVELTYSSPTDRPVMSEEWKWVLRGASSTRPVLRALPTIPSLDQQPGTAAAMFSDTRGLFRISGGEGGALSAVGNQTDLGTAFALATSLFGAHQLELSGNLGYASHGGIPSAGFRTGFTRSSPDGEGPEVNVTMRQVFLPSRVGAALAGSQPEGVPALQSISVAFADRRQVTDNLSLEYGSTLESVSFLKRLNYASPFARVTWGTLENGMFEAAFSSGAPAVELLESRDELEANMTQDLTSLSLFPRVSLRGGNAEVQRVDNYDIGYRRAFGSRTVSLGAWRESVTDAAFTMAAPAGFYAASELLPDLASNSSVFNAGDYRRAGYTASLTQKIGEDLNATVAFGRAGGLTAASAPVGSNPDDLRARLHNAGRNSITARVNGIAPGTATRYVVSYQWTDYSVFQPIHLSLTGSSNEPGFNISLRQPIPGVVGVIPGRLEATAELRNLLEQGYLPLATADGRQVILISYPRAVRGGLSFIF